MSLSQGFYKADFCVTVDWEGWGFGGGAPPPPPNPHPSQLSSCQQPCLGRRIRRAAAFGNRGIYGGFFAIVPYSGEQAKEICGAASWGVDGRGDHRGIQARAGML